MNIKAKKKGISLIEATISMCIFTMIIIGTIDSYSVFKMSLAFNKKYNESIKRVLLVKNQIYNSLSYDELENFSKNNKTFYIEAKSLDYMVNENIKNEITYSKNENHIKVDITKENVMCVNISCDVVLKDRKEKIETNVYKGMY